MKVILVALLLASAAVAQDKTFSTIFRYTCDGQIEFFPTAFFGFSATMPYLASFSNNAMQLLRDRAECNCPDFNEDYFNLLFNPLYALSNGIGNSSADVPSNDCLRENFKRHILEFQHIKVQTPDSCTYQTVKNNDKCLIQEHIPEFDITLKAAFGVCKHNNAATFLPRISVHCEGDGCSFLTKPCDSSNDCPAASTCLSPFERANISIADLPNKIFEAFQEIGFYGPNDVSPGCYQSSRGNGAKTPDNDIPTRMFTFVVNDLLGANKGIVTNPKFCVNQRILDTIVNATTCNNNNGNGNGQGGGNNGGNGQAGGSDEECVTMPPQFSPAAATITVTGNTSHCMAPGGQSRYVALPYLSSWDGKVYGTDVFQASNDIPSLPPVPTMTNAAPIARFTCDGAFSVQSNDFGIRLKDKYVDLIDFVADTLFDIMKCRISPELTQLEFIREYIPSNPVFWLYAFEKNASPAISRAQQANWETLAALLNNNIPMRLTNLPSTCNLENWIANKRCDLKFTGLRSMLQLDIDIGFRSQECPGNSGLSSIDLFCLGSDCGHLFNGLNTCSAAGMCPSTMQCLDFISELKTRMNSVDEQKALKIAFDTDVFDHVMGPRLNNDVCDPIAPFDVDPTTNPSFNSSNSCNGPARWRQDIHKFIVRTLGSPTADENAAPLKFCVFNKQVIEGTFDFEEWVKSLITTNGNDITLNAVSAVIIADDGTTTLPTAAPTETEAPNNNASSLSALTALISASLVAFLFAFQA